jgi:ankyrin repeat protein
MNKDPNKRLWDACRSHNFAEVLKAIQDGANINSKDMEGWTPLMVATLTTALFKEDLKLVNLLIEKGADVNAKNIDGWTPLMIAAYIGDAVLAKLLIDIGEDVNAKNKKGETALTIASSQGNNNVVEIIKKAIEEKSEKFPVDIRAEKEKEKSKVKT